jgi:hypothetical protein
MAGSLTKLRQILAVLNNMHMLQRTSTAAHQLAE